MATPRRNFEMIGLVVAYRKRKVPLSYREIARRLPKNKKTGKQPSARQVVRWAQLGGVDNSHK